MYSKAVLNLFINPINAGRIMKPDGIASLSNEDETANVEFSLRIEDDVITDCNFRAQANPYITAICSTITKMVKGKNIDEVMLDSTSVKKALGDEEDIDITFCIECLDLAIQDYIENREKENKPKSTRGRKKKVFDVPATLTDNLKLSDEEVVEEAEEAVEPEVETEPETNKTEKEDKQPHITNSFEGSIFNNPIFVNFFPNMNNNK